MDFLPLDIISISDKRIRRDFDPKRLAELKSSIARNGLFTPIAVEKQDYGIFLRAGERRVRVVKELHAEHIPIHCGDTVIPVGAIPVINFGDLTELQRLEIEVEENCIRTDFTWKERTAAYVALHRLRSAQNPNQTFSATANEIVGNVATGRFKTTISDALIIEQHFDDPDVVAAKDEGEALKIIRKKAEVLHRAKLAVHFDMNAMPHKLLHGDSKELLQSLKPSSFDVILTDPPYGIGADSFGTMAGVPHEYVDSLSMFKKMLEWLPDALIRISRPQAHAYIFCDLRNFEELSVHMLLAGWTCFSTPLVWDKCGSGMLPYPEYGPRRTYELILYAWRGDKKVLRVASDVIRVPAIRELKHAAQKPVALYTELLSRSANPGDTVIDPFGGSGTILPAANIRQMVATYIEQDKAMFDLALTRASVRAFDDGSSEQDGIDLGP